MHLHIVLFCFVYFCGFVFWKNLVVDEEIILYVKFPERYGSSIATSTVLEESPDPRLYCLIIRIITMFAVIVIFVF